MYTTPYNHVIPPYNPSPPYDAHCIDDWRATSSSSKFHMRCNSRKFKSAPCFFGFMLKEQSQVPHFCGICDCSMFSSIVTDLWNLRLLFVALHVWPVTCCRNVGIWYGYIQYSILQYSIEYSTVCSIQCKICIGCRHSYMRRCYCKRPAFEIATSSYVLHCLPVRKTVTSWWPNDAEVAVAQNHNTVYWL